LLSAYLMSSGPLSITCVGGCADRWGESSPQGWDTWPLEIDPSVSRAALPLGRGPLGKPSIGDIPALKALTVIVEVFDQDPATLRTYVGRGVWSRLAFHRFHTSRHLSPYVIRRDRTRPIGAVDSPLWLAQIRAGAFRRSSATPRHDGHPRLALVLASPAPEPCGVGPRIAWFPRPRVRLPDLLRRESGETPLAHWQQSTERTGQQCEVRWGGCIAFYDAPW
jgi:hypothetical protein